MASQDGFSDGPAGGLRLGKGAVFIAAHQVRVATLLDDGPASLV
jgi:hypothetical protein